LTPQNQILLVDHQASSRDHLADILSKDGHRVTEVNRGDEALDLLGEKGFHLIICDLDVPGADGLEILGYVEEHLPGTPVIIITSHGTVDDAVGAMRQGAFDFQKKPINPEHARLTVGRALQKAQLNHAYDYLRHEQPYIYRLEAIVAESVGMQEVLKKVAKVAATDVTVLLTGETGTGKSLMAGAIHANSPRRDNTLVTVNCAALTETLLESELFGHEKGSFTGAHKARTGRIQQAHGGTLFMDEVGDMSPATQAKVLRAIEEKEIQPVGSARSIQVDVRIIAATNLELAKAVEEGRFRQDLFYRLSVAPVHMPPLRKRPEDVLPLAEGFRQNFGVESKSTPREFSQEALQAMVAHPWPGNIRELKNAVERAVLFAAGREISTADLGLSPTGRGPEQSDLSNLNLKDLEFQAIETALQQSDWVQSKAAALLGISPRALSYKLDKLGIRNPRLADRRRRS
jgi:DNA-binding NtrC family response regulator